MACLLILRMGQHSDLPCAEYAQAALHKAVLHDHAPALVEEEVHTLHEVCHYGVQGCNAELLRAHLPHQQQALVCGVRQQGKLQEILAGSVDEPIANQTPPHMRSL